MFSTHGLVEGDFAFELDEKVTNNQSNIQKSNYRTRYRRPGLLVKALWRPIPAIMMLTWLPAA